MTNCSKGWANRCPLAKSPKCTCACGGENHGNPEVRQKALEFKAPEKRFAVPTELIRQDLQGKIIGFRKGGRAVVYVNGEWLSPEYSQTLVNHSPDGFEWGYGGSGPSQLALAIALKFSSKDLALRIYQQFKWDFVAKLKGDKWELDYKEIQNWFADNLALVERQQVR